MNQLYDTHVPFSLKQLQCWFASIITRPLCDQNKIMPLAPSGRAIDTEANDFVAPSPTMEPYRRLEIYNQQYWWRLIGTLHEGYPLLLRLFGYDDFNRSIGVPYLCSHPPSHWSLFSLGDMLPQWIKEAYQKEDKELVVAAAVLDHAFNAGFIAPHRPLTTSNSTLDEKGAEALMVVALRLQEHLQLFHWPWELISFRRTLLQQPPDHWVDNEFPALEKVGPYCFVVYRNRSNNMVGEKISWAEYSALRLFHRTLTLAELCGQLERDCDEATYEEVAQNFAPWLQKWITQQWLAI